MDKDPLASVLREGVHASLTACLAGLATDHGRKEFSGVEDRITIDVVVVFMDDDLNGVDHRVFRKTRDRVLQYRFPGEYPVLFRTSRAFEPCAPTRRNNYRYVFGQGRIPENLSFTVFIARAFV